MRTKLIFFALSVSVALGQTVDVARVFHLIHVDSERDLKEFATLIRTMSDASDVTTDAAQKTLSVRGTASQIAIAEWLFTELDQPQLPDSVPQTYRVLVNGDDVVRVLHVPNAAGVQQFQEIATAVRSIADIRRAFTYTASRAFAVRGTADQVEAAEWVVHELDQPANVRGADSPEHRMIDPVIHADTSVRVFYVPYTTTVQEFQEVATLIRSIGDIRRVFTYNARRAMVVRGTPDQMTLVSWLKEELGKSTASNPAASQTYTYPDVERDGATLIRVFYMKNMPTVPAFQTAVTQIRMATKMRRVFTYNASRAVAVRGTAEQLAMTEQMIKERQIAAK
jgi:hypothetical protein